jgi:D-alanine transaminase
MTTDLMAYVNDIFVPLEDAKVHIEDRGFQFADGVYEVIACFSGNFLDLDAHLERLQRSCDAIALPMPKSIDELKNLVAQTYTQNPFEDAMVYIQVTRGVAPRSHIVQQALSPTLVMTSRALPQPSDEKLAQGVKAITRQDIRWKHCEIKSIALLASVMGKQEAVKQGVDETFWLDEQGHVLEGCATNAFAVIDGVIVTHPLDHQVLGGITREMALAAARKLGYSVKEREWKLDEQGLSECMMSSTTNAIMPVCEVDGQNIADGKPGQVCLQLRQEMLAQLQALRDS